MNILPLVYDYKFEKIKKHVVSAINISDYFNLIIPSKYAPNKGDLILVEDSLFKVKNVEDEIINGLLCSRVEFMLYGAY